MANQRGFSISNSIVDGEHYDYRQQVLKVVVISDDEGDGGVSCCGSRPDATKTFLRSSGAK